MAMQQLDKANVPHHTMDGIPNRKDVLSIVGLSILCAVIVVAFMAGFINSSHKSQRYVEENFASPGAVHQNVENRTDALDTAK